jgi:autotransporter translocation and assembly factor TamB
MPSNAPPTGSPAPGPEGTPRRKGSRRLLRGLRVFVAGFVVLAVVVGVFLAFLLQTGPGQTLVLRTVLSQVDRVVQEGRVEVASIRSDGLLRGMTLRGVAIRDAGGRPFLEADSIRVAYSVRTFFQREVVLTPVDVWAPRVVIETLHGEPRSNLARIFLPPPVPDPDVPVEEDEPDELPPDPIPVEEPAVEPVDDGPSLRIELGRVAIHGGELIVRTPVDGEPAPRIQVEEVPGIEGLHQVVRFHEIQARLSRAELLTPAGERFEVGSLSLIGQIFEDPFRIEDFRGEVRRVAERLELEAEHVRLDATELGGRLALDWSDEAAGMTLEVAMQADPIRLEDFRWVEPRLPQGEGRLTLAGEGPLDAGRWRLTDVDIRAGSSRIRGEAGVDLGAELTLAATDLEFLPLELSLLDSWLEEPLPVGGRLEGRARLNGPFRALRVDGNLTYSDPAVDLPASTVRATGILHLGDPLGVTELSLFADPFRYGTLSAFFPDAPIQGEGTLRVEASGSLAQGLRFTADARHGVDGLESRVLALGSVRQVDGDFRLSVDGNLEPLSLDGLARATALEIPAEGEIRAQLRLEGLLSDLRMDGRVQTPGGVVAVDIRTDIRDPGAGYRLVASTSDLDLTAFLPDLPTPSLVSGSVEAEGRGLDLETVEGSGELTLTDSRVGEAVVDRVTARIQARGGVLQIDELELVSPLAHLTARGELGLRAGTGTQEGERPGTGVLEVAWEVEDFHSLRPLLIGDTLIVADTLTQLERDILIFDGLDPDALEETRGPPLEGRAQGELQLRGSIPDLVFDGWVRMAEVVWDQARLGEGRLDFQGRSAGRELRGVEGELELETPAWGRWEFQHVEGEMAYAPGEGSAQVTLLRQEAESYRVQGRFAHDTVGVDVDLDVLELNLDPVQWTLAQPARIRIQGRRFEVDDLEVRRPDPVDRPANGPASGPVRMRVAGVLDLEGESRLRAEAEGVDLERLAGILQFDPRVAGTLDLELDLEGAAQAPVMDGRILIRDLAMDDLEVSRVEGTLEYRDRVARTQLGVEQDGRRLLRLAGSYPVDLAFTEVETRLSDQEVDLVLSVDSLPAATLLAMLDVLEDVEGVLDGEMELRGPPRNLRPSGSLRLSGGALSLPEIGLHPRGIEADFTVEPDGVIRVDGQARARGTARVQGTVDLSDLTDPGFDLRVDASGFQAVERRDLEARVGGQVNLSGSFTRPRVTGNVRVEQGVIFLEEFARTAEVVDLTDPSFFDVVDTTLVAVRPVVEAAQNPFLQNLRVDVDLSIQRDFWLRSREINVEMGGDLIVAFDRARRDILLVGILEATRGNYVAFGRQFQVREGMVEFVGTPGVNPTLAIEAVHRLRREGGEPLEILASVGGTLLNPRVSLSSEAQPPIAQSDLISYLIFGRPSYALGSGETSVLEGAAGAGVSAVTGTIATQLSQILARQIGLDFFTITQAQESDVGGLPPTVGSAFAGTQVEVGQYLRENLFLALVLRPLQGIGGTQAQLPGARLEWRFSDTWTMEGYVEDRFGRQGVYTFGQAGLQVSRIFGIELFREWGY